MKSRSEINHLIASELGAIENSEILKQAANLMTKPMKKSLEWEYGDNEIFDSWFIADLGERDVWVTYCEGGHGALGYPWGLVFKDSTQFGMDNGWYASLSELFAEWFG